MYRDLADGWKSFVAILIICLLSTSLFMGFDLTWRGMNENIRNQFALGNLADIWVRGEISGNDARKIERLDGVLAAQKRVSAEGEAEKLPGAPQIKLLMSEGEPAVNKPVIYSGENFAPGKKDQCILQKRFADANHLAVGDLITVTVEGQNLSLTICGLGTLPEFVIYNKEGEAVTVAASYGYAIVSPGTLGFLPYSEISLTVKPGADAQAVRREVREVVDKDRTTVIMRADKSAVKDSMEQISQLKMIGMIVPLLFFLVAALITWTTMGRLVENQRTQIGSLFAMGYGQRTILMHYAEYGVFIAILGAFLGFAGAIYGFSPLLLWFLQTVYIMPGAAPYLSVPTMAIKTLAMVLLTGGAGVLSARNALTRSPADLLRPRPPKKAKKVFLERIPFIWKRLSFSGKIIARSMLRSRVRLFMGLVGTIGCTALMLIGFGLRDTVEFAKWDYYTNTLAYDLRVTLERGAPDGYAKSIKNRTGAAAAEEEMITAMDVYLNGDWKEKPVFVLENGQQLIRLEDEAGRRTKLPPSGVTLTRKMAEEYHIRVGDVLRMHASGKRDTTAAVTQIVNLEMGQGLYFSRESWRKLDLQPFAATAVLLRRADGY
jgi:putative ABC transport system permease protein